MSCFPIRLDERRHAVQRAEAASSRPRHEDRRLSWRVCLQPRAAIRPYRSWPFSTSADRQTPASHPVVPKGRPFLIPSPRENRSGTCQAQARDGSQPRNLAVATRGWTRPETSGSMTALETVESASAIGRGYDPSCDPLWQGYAFVASQLAINCANHKRTCTSCIESFASQSPLEALRAHWLLALPDTLPYAPSLLPPVHRCLLHISHDLVSKCYCLLRT